jgi:hypothetical protein
MKPDAPVTRITVKVSHSACWSAPARTLKSVA